MLRLLLLMLLAASGLPGCGKPEPRAVRLGQEECAHCRMNVVEARYAAQLVTPKGRTYVFDDVVCLRGFLREQPEIAAAQPLLFVADVSRPGAWLPVAQAHFVRSPLYRTPMNGQVAAFATDAAARAAQQALAQPGQLLSWADIPAPDARP